MKAQLIDIKLIDAGERRRADYGDINGLIESIKKQGLIQPLAVHARDGRYLLLAGGRRHKACQLLGFTEVPVRIYDQDLSELDARSIELAENIDRKDLSWSESAALKKEIHDLQIAKVGSGAISRDGEGWRVEDTAKMLGVATGTVSQDIMLAEAVKLMPELGTMKNKTDALALLKHMEKKGDTVKKRKELEAYVKDTPEATRKNALIESFIIRDFFEGVALLPSGKFDIIELDPPYAIDQKNMRGDNNELYAARSAEYNEVKDTDYPEFMLRVISECFRVAAPNSWLICWHAVLWQPVIRQLLESAGWKVMQVPAIWTKMKGPTMNPECVLASAWEPFLYARKGDATLNRKGHLNVFSCQGIEAAQRSHPTERPVELIQEVLSTFASEGSRLFVPFLGSGNTLLAGSNLHMAGLGFELGTIYKEHFAVRVMEGAMHSFKSQRAVKKEEKEAVK